MNLPLVVAGMFGDVQKEQKRLIHVTHMRILCNHDAGFAMRVSPRMDVFPKSGELVGSTSSWAVISVLTSCPTSFFVYFRFVR